MQIKMSERLIGLVRCPHCGVAYPEMERLWMTENSLRDGEDKPRGYWATYRCTTCGAAVLARGRLERNPNVENFVVVTAIFPQIRTAASELPERARTYLQQAYESLNAPDGAAMLAGSAVDAMLKEKGYTEGTLYDRIDKAVSCHLLTEDMGKWAHQVRLGSNRPRHADQDAPHVTPKEARQSVEFVRALGEFLYVLPTRIEQGIAASTPSMDEAAQAVKS